MDMSCSRSHTGGLDSESHFLRNCVDDCPGDLVCICGVCTIACDDDKTCTPLDPKATCTESTDVPAPLNCHGRESVAICDLDCRSDEQCSTVGNTFECQSGFCRELLFQPFKSQTNSSIDAALDAQKPIDANMDSGFDSMNIPEVDSSVDSNIEAAVSDVRSTLNALPLCESYEDDAGVFDNEDDSVDAVPTCADIVGSDPTAGATSVGTADYPSWVSTHESRVYWYREGIVSALADGSDLKTVVPEFDPDYSQPSFDLIDETYLYWVSSNGVSLRIYKAPLEGGVAVVLDEEPGANPSGLTMDDEYIYWASDESSSLGSEYCDLYRTPKQLGDSSVLLTLPECLSEDGIQLVGDRLYWLGASTSTESTDGLLRSMHKEGTEPPIVEVMGLAQPMGLTVDGSYLYWSNWGSYDRFRNHVGNGSIMRLETSSGKLEIIADNLVSPKRSKIDDLYIYWLQTNAVNGYTTDLIRASKGCDFPPSYVVRDIRSRGIFVVDDMYIYWNDECSDDEHVIMKIPKT